MLCRTYILQVDFSSHCLTSYRGLTTQSLSSASEQQYCKKLNRTGSRHQNVHCQGQGMLIARAVCKCDCLWEVTYKMFLSVHVVPEWTV
ncbi:hypothetical protein Mapa_016877 [Marchantia paleacea]|nr:hypothetical protein Mapa_016877 [Marchantia paleacea]